MLSLAISLTSSYIFWIIFAFAKKTCRYMDMNVHNLLSLNFWWPFYLYWITIENETWMISLVSTVGCIPWKPLTFKPHTLKTCNSKIWKYFSHHWWYQVPDSVTILRKIFKFVKDILWRGWSVKLKFHFKFDITIPPRMIMVKIVNYDDNSDNLIDQPIEILRICRLGCNCVFWFALKSLPNGGWLPPK